MDEAQENKRVFFGFEIDAPWPHQLPQGRKLEEGERHMTAAFLGKTDFSNLKTLIPSMPLPPFKVGLGGYFDKIHFLPQAHPRVVAWNVAFFDSASIFFNYIEELKRWLVHRGLLVDDSREFLAHVTVCRSPFNFHDWRKAFEKLPLCLTHFHLYESLGQLHYKPLWTHHLELPFEELEHTADVAFKIRGESLKQLFWNAFTALACKSPELVKFRKEGLFLKSIDDVIIGLNEVIAHADMAFGCPFKAVSFHGDIIEEKSGILSWEMIVDV